MRSRCAVSSIAVIATLFLSSLDGVCGQNRSAREAARFELAARELGLSSQATLTAERLQIVAADGALTEYGRDRRFDSQDGQWLGFQSQVDRQILRWPTSNSGRMQIGTRSGNSIVFRASQMTIRPLVGASPNVQDPQIIDRPVLPPDVGGDEFGEGSSAVSDLFARVTDTRGFASGSRPDAQMIRLVSYDSRGTSWLISRGSGLDLVVSSVNAPAADWWVSPTDHGYVRVQTYRDGRVYALAAAATGNISLVPVAQDPRQLWRVSSSRLPNRFILENAALVGQCLTHLGGGQLALQPIGFTAMQLWVPQVVPSRVAWQPFWRSVSTEIVPNSPLPPARLDLVNNHKYALIVALGDVRRGEALEQIRIEPNSAKTIELDRDSGATLVETVEIRSPAGIWDRQQYVTAIPARAVYDLSVYEEHLQSIAIDATGKSPNPIEDVHYVPKSVGWLPLPSGSEMPAAGRMDLYAQAKAANNPGAVRRLDANQFDEQPTTNPLEQILNRFESTPRRNF